MVKVSQLISHKRVIYHFLMIFYNIISVKYQLLLKVINFLNDVLSISHELKVKLMSDFLRLIFDIPPDILEFIESLDYHRSAIEDLKQI